MGVLTGRDPLGRKVAVGDHRARDAEGLLGRHAVVAAGVRPEAPPRLSGAPGKANPRTTRASILGDDLRCAERPSRTRGSASPARESEPGADESPLGSRPGGMQNVLTSISSSALRNRFLSRRRHGVDAARGASSVPRSRSLFAVVCRSRGNANGAHGDSSRRGSDIDLTQDALPADSRHDCEFVRVRVPFDCGPSSTRQLASAPCEQRGYRRHEACRNRLERKPEGLHRSVAASDPLLAPIGLSGVVSQEICGARHRTRRAGASPTSTMPTRSLRCDF